MRRPKTPNTPPAPQVTDEHAPTKGIECRECGCRHFLVVWVEPKADGAIRRRRECRHCGERVTTIERRLGS